MIFSADPDQLASSEANWSGSAMLEKVEYIRVQHDKGKSYTGTKTELSYIKLHPQCRIVVHSTKQKH